MKSEAYIVEQIIAIEGQPHPDNAGYFDDMGVEEQVELMVLHDILDRALTKEERKQIDIKRRENFLVEDEEE